MFDAVYDNIRDLPDDSRVIRDSILDITDHLDESGNLHWKVPQGEWLILRFGHTHTGIHLQATNPQNKGLGMNHLSGEAAQKHFEEIGLKMVADIEAAGGNSFKYFYLDSWEVRIANWTPGFRREFQIRRGYDMTPYLPVLAGRIVDNREISNRFLHDYRQTIGDCIADNYYGQFRDQSHQHGLQFRAEMATTPIPVDMLKCLGRCDVPFGEFWTETDLEKGRVESGPTHSMETTVQSRCNTLVACRKKSVTDKSHQPLAKSPDWRSVFTSGTKIYLYKYCQVYKNITPT